MRIPAIVLPLAAAILASVAAQPSSSPSANSGVGQNPREVALDNLLSERESITALDAAIADARKAGVSAQAILEARFLYHVDRREDAAIAAMLPEFLKQSGDFKIEDSVIFAVKEDWLAVVEYVKAIVALSKDEKDAFKKHITEAFWLSPRQAAAFAPHIERLRLEESMRSVKIDFSIKLAPVNPGDPVSLESLFAGKKAMLLHFWSPMSQECEAAMPDFVATARALASNEIAVVSLVPDDAPKLLTDARAMIHPLGREAPGAWLIDSKDKSLGRDLRIQNLPSMALLTPDGKVIFNGDPTDGRFWETLEKIDARITRPRSASDSSK